MNKNLPNTIVSILFKMISCIILAIIVSIIVEWIGMAFIWRDNPEHAKEMLNYEYYLVNDSFENFMFGDYLFNTMNNFFSSIYIYTQRILLQIKHEQEIGSHLSFINNFTDYLKAAGYIFFLVLMRTFVFIISLPWFLICGVVAFSDGLVERSIRKFEGGVEHGMIHHLAKSNFTFVIAIAFIFYLGIPIPIHPSIVIIPFGILFGLIIYIAAWSFKKYL